MFLIFDRQVESFWENTRITRTEPGPSQEPRTAVRSATWRPALSIVQTPATASQVFSTDPCASVVMTSTVSVFLGAKFNVILVNIV